MNGTHRLEMAIAKELSQSLDSRIYTQCDTIRDVVNRGVFSLEEALQTYETKEDDYVRYLANFHLRTLQKDIVGTSSDSLSYKLVIGIISDIIRCTFPKSDEATTMPLLEELKQFSVKMANT